MATQYLDLDAVQPEHEFTVKLNDKVHVIRQTTVSDFIANAKDIEALGVGASLVDEVETNIRIIQRAVPTASKEDLEGLNFTQLAKVRDFVMTANGERVEEKTEASAEGNATKVDS